MPQWLFSYHTKVLIFTKTRGRYKFISHILGYQSWLASSTVNLRVYSMFRFLYHVVTKQCHVYCKICCISQVLSTLWLVDVDVRILMYWPRNFVLFFPTWFNFQLDRFNKRLTNHVSDGCWYVGCGTWCFFLLQFITLVFLTRTINISEKHAVCNLAFGPWLRLVIGIYLSYSQVVTSSTCKVQISLILCFVRAMSLFGGLYI